MADKSKIEWTDATVNAINGCSVISAGCTNCYAMRSGGRNLPNYPSTGLTAPSKAGHVWTGEVRLNEKAMLTPLSWKRPRRIFWNAHGDMFHDNVPESWIDQCFAVMALTPQHTHMVLTKRPARMREYMTRMERAFQHWFLRCDPAGLQEMQYFATAVANPCGPREWPLPNVWLGTSVEDQSAADARIPDLLATPAAVRFLSCEPLLGPIDLVLDDLGTPPDHLVEPINWVITGGESGRGARPTHPDWVRSIRDQCADAEVPFHFKQWGEWVPLENDADWEKFGTKNAEHNRHLDQNFALVGKSRAGRLLDGVEHNGRPG